MLVNLFLFLLLLLCCPALCTQFRLSFSFIDLTYGRSRVHMFFGVLRHLAARLPRARHVLSITVQSCFFLFARFVLFACLFIIVVVVVELNFVFFGFSTLNWVLQCFGSAALFYFALFVVVVVVVVVISGVDELIVAISCTRCTNFQLSCRSWHCCCNAAVAVRCCCSASCAAAAALSSGVTCKNVKYALA